MSCLKTHHHYDLSRIQVHRADKEGDTPPTQKPSSAMSCFLALNTYLWSTLISVQSSTISIGSKYWKQNYKERQYILKRICRKMATSSMSSNLLCTLTGISCFLHAHLNRANIIFSRCTTIQWKVDV